MVAPRQGSLLPALILMGLSVTWTAVLSLTPREGEVMAAIYPPGAGDSLAAASAAGDVAIIASGNWPSVVLVRSDQPGLARRLRAAGAWLVVRAPAAGCMR